MHQGSTEYQKHVQATYGTDIFDDDCFKHFVVEQLVKLVSLVSMEAGFQSFIYTFYYNNLGLYGSLFQPNIMKIRQSA